MSTDRYCPICRLRLRDVRGHRNVIGCRNGHLWEWLVYGDIERLSLYASPEGWADAEKE